MHAEQELGQPEPGAEKVVLRPRLWVYAVFGPILLGVFALCAGVIVESVREGQPLGILVFAPLAALCLGVLMYFAGGTIWAHADRVGSTQILSGGSCRRDELASVRIGPPYSRSGPSYAFVLKDGSVAFSTPTALWSAGRIKALAQFLRVPVIDATRAAPRGFVCPVCGFPGLNEAASSNGTGSGEICPSCGFDNRGPVDERRYADWRQQWIDGGMAWWAAQAGRPAPKDWDPVEQVKALTG